jgi:hypothetical protein
MQQRSKNRLAKARQASKLAEIRAALDAAGFHSIDKQAAALGLGRSTAWAVFNSEKRAGPSANIIKRMLSSRTLPSAARQKIEEYVEEKISGAYGHSQRRAAAFRDQVDVPYRQQRRLKHLPKLSGARLHTFTCLC